MSNTLLTPSMITKESLRILKNSLTFAKNVTRNYDDKFGVEGAKIGNTLNIRKPARYVGRNGATLSVENQTETFVPLTLNTQFGVDLQFTSQDQALSLDDYSNRVLKPAVATIANKIDRDGLAQAVNVFNFTGVPGTVPSTTAAFLTAGARMDDQATPRDGQRAVVISPWANASMVGALTNIFNPVKTISEQYTKGYMGNGLGFDWSMDQNVVSQTIGTYTGSPVVNGASQAGSSLITNGWGNSLSTLLNVGDIFTIAGVHSVNPQSRQSTGQLANFVVTATAVSDGSGNSTIAIYPAITTSGQFQTVDVSPANSAVITVYGASGVVSPMNLAYHPDAFILGTADLQIPKGVDMAARASDKDTGLSIRMIRAYDVVNDLFVTRLDVLYGWATVYPELACRIQG